MIMREVLGMMQSAKEHHQTVLERLNDPPPTEEEIDSNSQAGPRRSSRLMDKKPYRNADFYYY